MHDSSDKVAALELKCEKLEIKLGSESGKIKMLEKEIEFNDKKYLTDHSNLKLENERLRH
jgi:hypothetical protein